MKIREYLTDVGYRTKDVPHLVLADPSIIGAEVAPGDACIVGARYCSKILSDGSVIDWIDYANCVGVGGLLRGSVIARTKNLKNGKVSAMLPRDALYTLRLSRITLTQVAFTNTRDNSTFQPAIF